MGTNFPAGLDALANPAAGDTQAGVPHAAQHANANDAVEALQAKVGVDGSAVATSLDYLVKKGVAIVAAAAPANPVTNQLWYDTAAELLKRWDGDSWEPSGSAAYAPGAAIGARAYLSASQSIASGSNVSLTFGAESFDTHSFHDNVTNNTRLTIPAGQGGVYAAVAQVQLPGTGGNRRVINVRKNGGSAAIFEMQPPTSASTFLRIQVADLLSLAAGDFIEIAVLQDSGGALTAAAGEFASFVSLVKLGT